MQLCSVAKCTSLLVSLPHCQECCSLLCSTPPMDTCTASFCDCQPASENHYLDEHVVDSCFEGSIYIIFILQTYYVYVYLKPL